VATLSYVIRATDEASVAFKKIADSADKLNADLDKLDGKTATPKLSLDARQFKVAADDIGLKLDKLDKRVTTTHMNDDQIRAARIQAERLQLRMDKLNAQRTKIHVDSSALTKLSKTSFLQPSLIGTAAALSPALIPLAGSIAGAVGAIGVSFGAAALASAGFGLMATTVLSGASQDLQKLQTLNVALLKASTAAQKKAAEQSIAALKAGWSKGYLDLIDNYQTFQKQWKSVSQAITVPALNAWLPALTRGLQFLKPALEPVAAVFKSWGQDLDRYFKSSAGSAEITKIAKAFGEFSAIQLGQIGDFIKRIGEGVFNLARDIGSGVNFHTFGNDLVRWGLAFEQWSKSAKARADVQGFLHFLHTEGPVVTGILKDLGNLLPGIFKGAATVGTLELKALGDFLNLVAKLPKGWQAPLTEAAGALLLMSKLGVLKVGIKLIGGVAKLLSGGTIALGGGTAAVEMKAAMISGGTQAAAEIRAAMAGGGAAAGAEGAGAAGAGAAGASISLPLLAGGAAMAAGFFLRLREDFKMGAKGFIRDIPNLFGGINGVLGTMVSGWADTIIKRFGGPLDKFAAPVRQKITNWFKGAGTWLVASGEATIAGLWAGIQADWRIVAAFGTSVKNRVVGWWNGSIGWLVANGRFIIGGLWSGITSRWAGVATWMSGSRGRINGFFRGALSWLNAAGRNVIQGLWNGLLFVWNKVKSFIGSIAGWIKAHKGPIALDSKLLEPAGRALMSGLHLGLLAGAKGPLGFISGLTGTIGSLLSKGLSGLLGGGGFADTGARSGSAAIAQSFARSILPRGWSFPALLSLWNQESGWSAYAVNQSSGAYGIPQSLGHGHPYNLGDYKAQIMWGLNYIAGRYGNSQNAWAHEQAFNWYGRGLTGGIFTRPTLIGVGERGPERVDITPGTGGGGGSIAETNALLREQNALLRQTLAAVKVAPAATSVGMTRALNGMVPR
jgi:hypothetical protein